MSLGDYNSTLVEGGDDGIVWLDSNNETEW